MLSNRQLFILFCTYFESGVSTSLSPREISDNFIFWLKQRFPEYEDADKFRVIYMISLMEKVFSSFINQSKI